MRKIKANSHHNINISKELFKISEIPPFFSHNWCLKLPLTDPWGGLIRGMEILESQTHAEPIFVGICWALGKARPVFTRNFLRRARLELIITGLGNKAFLSTDVWVFWGGQLGSWTSFATFPATCCYVHALKKLVLQQRKCCTCRNMPATSKYKLRLQREFNLPKSFNHLSNVQNPVDIPLYWLVNGDPYNGLL